MAVCHDVDMSNQLPEGVPIDPLDEGGRPLWNGPAEPIAFRTAPGQGVNIGRNIWHGILTPLDKTSDFAVVDRGGEGVNLEEHFYTETFLVR